MNKYKTFLNQMYKLDYKERPPDMTTFLCDEYFLGKSTKKGEAIYPIWRESLYKISKDDSKLEIVFTGAIGIGKTNTAILGSGYCMCVHLCLRDPWGYYGLAPTGKMAIMFFNLTKTLSGTRGFTSMQDALLKSPWFLEKGRVRGKMDQYIDFDLFEYMLSSPYAKGFGTQGGHVIVALLDELDSPDESSKQKAKVLKAYTNCVRRFESRFVIDGRSLGRMFLVTSKQDELSFIEGYINQRKSSGRILVFDVPLWEAKPDTNYSGKTFPVMVGDAYTEPRIIEESDREEWIKKGLKVIDVPIEHQKVFGDDIVGALRDIAGITTKGMRSRKLFPSEKLLRQCYDPDKPDPVRVATIEIGLDDESELMWYIDLDKIRLDRKIPRFIHYDISFSADCTSLVMSGVKEWRIMEVEAADGTFQKTRLPVIETDFVFRIKAREGDRIPIHKVRKFVLDLRAAGFNIKSFTADLRLASEDTLQVLQKAKINAGYFSVDKDDKPYIDFRNLVFEGRWVMHEHPVAHFELKNLEHDPKTRKVDHPDMVADIEFLGDGDVKEIALKGSKDVSDGICGSVVGCLYDTKPPKDVQGMTTALKGAINKMEAEKGKVGDMPEDWFLTKKHKGKVLVTKESKTKAKLNALKGIR